MWNNSTKNQIVQKKTFGEILEYHKAISIGFYYNTKSFSLYF
jgi:hypothetical protein